MELKGKIRGNRVEIILSISQRDLIEKEIINKGLWGVTGSREVKGVPVNKSFEGVTNCYKINTDRITLRNNKGEILELEGIAAFCLLEGSSDILLRLKYRDKDFIEGEQELELTFN